MLTSYLKWHIIFNFLPQLVMWLVFWNRLKRYKKTIVFTAIFCFAVGFIWDTVASTWWRIWNFETAPNLNIYFLGLPLEEYIFLLTAPAGMTGVILLIKEFIRKE